MSAVHKGNKEVVEILLRAGADVNDKNEQGITALMSAVHKGNKEVVEILLSSGADINDNNNNNERAVQFANRGLASFLISEGANSDGVTKITTDEINKAKSIYDKKIKNEQKILRTIFMNNLLKDNTGNVELVEDVQGYMGEFLTLVEAFRFIASITNEQTQENVKQALKNLKDDDEVTILEDDDAVTIRDDAVTIPFKYLIDKYLAELSPATREPSKGKITPTDSQKVSGENGKFL